MKIIFLALALAAISGAAYAQIRQDPIPTYEQVIEQIAPELRELSGVLPWETLATTTFERQKFHDENYKIDYFVEMPVFSDAVKTLDGKDVTVKGFMNIYELKASHGEFLLAPIPMEGEGHYDGPGSLVIEVHMAQAAEYQPGLVTVKGRFELVPGDLKAKGIYYRLRDAVLVK